MNSAVRASHSPPLANIVVAENTPGKQLPLRSGPGESCDVWERDHLSLANGLNPVSHGQGHCHERSGHHASLSGRLADDGF